MQHDAANHLARIIQHNVIVIVGGLRTVAIMLTGFVLELAFRKPRGLHKADNRGKGNCHRLIAGLFAYLESYVIAAN